MEEKLGKDDLGAILTVTHRIRWYSLWHLAL
jgi:hypothetical protein